MPLFDPLKDRLRAALRSVLRTAQDSRFFIVVSIVGPGLIAGNAGNDAGGIATTVVVTRHGARMVERLLLTPREAGHVVEERIEQFGLGAMPRVSVTATADATWCVRWEHVERTVAPMTMDEWHAWIEENIGSLDAGDLETTES